MRIYYILDNILVLSYQFLSELHIESLTGYENMTQKEKFPEDGNFPGYGRPAIKYV